MAKISIDIKEGKVKKESNFIVGIDLGTTNSLVSFITDDEIKVLTDSNGRHMLVPSIISFDDTMNIIVGQSAKDRLVSHPERTIFSVKRLMGKSFRDIMNFDNLLSYNIIDSDTEELVKIEIDGKYFTPIELSAEILKSLKQQIERQLDQEIDKAVITVPAYFNDTQRQATRDAGKLAGLDVLRVINEPTAASLAYGVGIKANEKQTVAIYDLGGGTFDVSVLLIEDQVFEVLATNGNTFLGGDDFDKKIVQYWLKENNLNINDFEESQTQAIRLLAERAKKELSQLESFKASIEIGSIVYPLIIDKEKFELLIQELIQETIHCCELALKDAKLSKTDIDKVILVGGSTRVPAVKHAVDQFFNKESNNELNPDEVVAIGAAIQADILAGNRKDMLLLDITPLSLGIETVGGLMDVIIPRNSKIPTRVGRKYTTSVDGQTKLKVSVYQGERDLVEDNRKLGEFILTNIPPMPAGIPQIEIQFLIDADGVMIVKAKELRSETETRVQIKSQYGISEEEMAKMLLDSIKNAKDDMEKRSLLECINEADNLLLASVKFLDQNNSWLSQDQKLKIKTLTSHLEEAKSTKSVDEIRSKMETLNSYTTPLAHEALDRNISGALSGKDVRSQ